MKDFSSYEISNPRISQDHGHCLIYVSLDNFGSFMTWYRLLDKIARILSHNITLDVDAFVWKKYTQQKFRSTT